MTEYIQDKIFKTVASMTLPLWTRVYQWVKLKKQVKAIKNGDILSFKIPANSYDNVIETNIDHYKSFEDFSKYAFGCYYVNEPDNNWRSGTCTSPSFYKEYICKHLEGMAIRYNFVVPSLEAKQVPLGQKRKKCVNRRLIFTFLDCLLML